MNTRTRSITLSPSRARVRSTIAAIIDQPDELRALRSYHKALADVNRLRIVQRLGLGEASVTELIDHVGLSQPLVSWHVGKLREARVVETSRVGRETVCRLRPETFSEFGARERAALGLDRPRRAPVERARSAPAPATQPEEAAS